MIIQIQAFLIFIIFVPLCEIQCKQDTVMELIVKIKNNSGESEVSRVIKYLRSQKCVRKFDLVTDDLKTIKSISDKETIDAIHNTTSLALADFLKKETESIF